jgi:hypothetical protein
MLKKKPVKIAIFIACIYYRECHVNAFYKKTRVKAYSDKYERAF